MFAAGMKIPEEEEQRNIIDKLANFVARNGPKFEDLTKSKQQDNPKFAFLFGGEHHEYYKWKVSLEATQAEAQKRLQQVKDQKEVPPEQQQAFPNPPPVVVKDEPNKFSLEEFKNLLQKLILVCTKDNIQNGKLWIVSNARTIDEMKLAMQYLLRRMLQEQLPFQQKLHVVYLANDILHYSKKKDMPMLLESLQDYILPIVALAYNGEASDAQEKLLKVLKIWDTQKFFSEEIRQALKTPSHLYDSQLDFIDKQRDEMNKEQSLQAMADQKPIPSMDQIPSHPPPHQPHHDFPQDNFPHGPPGQHGPPGMHGPPPDQFGDPYQQQFDQPWNHPSGGPPGGPDPYHFYGNQYRPPPPQQGFPPFQQGFQEPPGNFEHGGPPPRGFPPFQDGPPPHQVQTFDYSHQSGLPGGIDQPNGGGPVTFDYEHGNAPIPDGAPPIPQHDPTIPMAPYYDLPAGLMVPLVKLWDCEYKPLDPKELRLPIPQPPSERLLAAIEAFYSPPSHDRPRDSQGWEKNGLFEFFKAKLKYIKDKERKLETVERTPSPPPSRASTPEAEGSPLVKERRRSRSRSPSPRGRSPIRGRSPNRRSYSRSRSRSRSRSYSKSRSASPRRSPIRRSPIRRSPTPPSSFLGFQTRSLDSKIEESNVGHQLLKKMGWGGQGLGKKESGIVDPIKAGEVRDNQDKFKGIGVEVNDPFEQYRKTRSYTYGHRSSKR